jgi:hypothetical protein
MAGRSRIQRFLIAVALVGIHTAIAQTPGKSERKLELIGLHRWTVQMVQDSLAAHFTGVDASLHSHACAANLQKIGFVRAAVQYFADPTDPNNSDKWTGLITLVEPNDSARVRTIRTLRDSLPQRPEWASLRDALTPGDSFHFWQVPALIQFYQDFKRGMTRNDLEAQLKDVGAPVKTIRAYELLARHTRPEDLKLALRTLQTDKDADNRVIAAAVLANFPNSDATWFALVRALRDPQEMIGTVAGKTLVGFAAARPRVIDWAPVGDDLRFIFGGTNVWQLKPLIEVLNTTQVSPALAALILGRNAELLASYAASSVTEVSLPAQRLLTRLSGKRLGADRDAWIKWANAL